MIPRALPRESWRKPAIDGRLPDRVARAIAAEQDKSEILVGWIQVAVLAVFGALYFASPKGFSKSAGVAPVPWALGAYGFFTLLRLGIARRRRLSDWLLSLSVILDMSLLLGLIFSFHLQYEEPPAFYLKAPTLLYVFIFIALRALRFEARYVLLAGAAAALGWLFLLLYAIFSESGGSRITRSFAVYMTSNSILLGAEIDKIACILIVTVILAVSLKRARSLLERSVSEEIAARELSRFLAPEVAAHIRGSQEQIAAGHGASRDAAILNVDLRGFTELSNTMTPDALIALLGEYQARMVPVIQRHGGSIDKFLGDGILATFGAAVPSKTAAADALRAADALMVEAAAWSAERSSRGKASPDVIAVAAAGRVIFGAVGIENRLEYTVIGEAVNLAAKLEKHAKVENARGLTTMNVLALAKLQGYEPAHPREVRPGRCVMGVAAPLDIVILSE